MKRRQFIAGLGATVTLPLGGRAQPAMPLIGYLGIGTLEEAHGNFAAVSRGLAEAGYVEGRNLSVEFRCADYHSEQLPALASDHGTTPGRRDHRTVRACNIGCPCGDQINTTSFFFTGF